MTNPARENDGPVDGTSMTVPSPGSASIRESRGRPSRVYDSELLRVILRLVRCGATPQSAAMAAGLSRSAFFSWMRRAKDAEAARLSGSPVASEDQQFLDFLDQINEAEAQAETDAVGHVASAARSGSWRASAWLLERRFPQAWGKPSDRTPPETPQPQPTVEVSVQDLERKVQAILRLRDGDPPQHPR